MPTARVSLNSSTIWSFLVPLPQKRMVGASHSQRQASRMKSASFSVIFSPSTKTAPLMRPPYSTPAANNIASFHHTHNVCRAAAPIITRTDKLELFYRLVCWIQLLSVLDQKKHRKFHRYHTGTVTLEEITFTDSHRSESVAMAVTRSSNTR